MVPSTLHQCFKYVDEKGKGETGYLPTISPFLKESRHTVCTDARLYNDGPAQTVMDDESPPAKAEAQVRRPLRIPRKLRDLRSTLSQRA